MPDISDTGEPARVLLVQPREMTAPELARRITHVLTAAAEKAAVPIPDNACFHIEHFAREIMLAVRASAKLPAADYRMVWGIWSIFRGHAHGRPE